MHTPEIEQDCPINMKDDRLLEFTDALPHMRFLFNDKPMFDLTIQLLLAGIRIINQGAVDKEKMRTVFKNILEQILCVNETTFKHLRNSSQNLVYLTDDYIDIVCQQNYYEKKIIAEFQFARHADDDPENDKQDEQMGDQEKQGENKG